jgi:hypothetical protein
LRIPLQQGGVLAASTALSSPSPASLFSLLLLYAHCWTSNMVFCGHQKRLENSFLCGTTNPWLRLLRWILLHTFTASLPTFPLPLFPTLRFSGDIDMDVQAVCRLSLLAYATGHSQTTSHVLSLPSFHHFVGPSSSTRAHAKRVAVRALSAWFLAAFRAEPRTSC